MMRTTLTLEDDVDHLLREVCARRGASYKEVVNEALRSGLAQMVREDPTPASRYRTQPVSLGAARLPNLDNIADVLALTEGEEHR